jgi:hypothetical protein
MIDRPVELARGIDHSCSVDLYCYMPYDIVLIDGSSGSRKRIGYYIVQFFAEQENWKVLGILRWIWRLFRTYSYYRQLVAGCRRASWSSWI